MPKDTKTLGNNKARACESLGFVHKKRLCQRFDTTSFYYLLTYIVSNSFKCLKHFVSRRETLCFITWNTLFQGMKHSVSTVETDGGTTSS